MNKIGGWSFALDKLDKQFGSDLAHFESRLADRRERRTKQIGGIEIAEPGNSDLFGDLQSFFPDDRIAAHGQPV